MVRALGLLALFRNAAKKELLALGARVTCRHWCMAILVETNRIKGGRTDEYLKLLV